MCASLQHGSYAHVEPAAHRASCHASCLGAVKHFFPQFFSHLSHTYYTLLSYTFATSNLKLVMRYIRTLSPTLLLERFFAAFSMK